MLKGAKKVLCLSIGLGLLGLLTEQAQAKQLVFDACREGECLRWYLVQKNVLRQNSPQQRYRQLFQVKIQEQSQYFRRERPQRISANQSSSKPPAQQFTPPQLVRAVNQTVKWVNCSRQVPFVAEGAEKPSADLWVQYLNPRETRPGLFRYYALYWAVCHSMVGPNNPSQLNLSVMAQKLGYPETLTYRSATVPRRVLLELDDR